MFQKQLSPGKEKTPLDHRQVLLKWRSLITFALGSLDVHILNKGIGHNVLNMGIGHNF
jgi:hypothetical protein